MYDPPVRSIDDGGAGTAVREATAAATWARRLRVRDWLHFLVLPLATWRPGDGATGPARGAVIAALVLAFGYLVNAVGDRDMDAPDKRVVDGREVRAATVVCAALAAAALIVAMRCSVRRTKTSSRASKMSPRAQRDSAESAYVGAEVGSVRVSSATDIGLSLSR
jgi:hypothetical protein